MMRRRMRSQRTRPFWLRRDSERCQSQPTRNRKSCQRRFVHGHSVVAEVSTHDRPQPLALFGDGIVHSSPQLGFHLVQLRLHPFSHRLPQHREPSVAPLLHADVREAEEVERLRLPFSTPLPLVDRKRSELQQPRLLGMQFQVELRQAFRQFRPELLGIRLAWNPTTMSSAKRTTMTSPCARF